MVFLNLSLILYISKSIKQLQVCFPYFCISILAQTVILGAYERVEQKKFKCMFLFVTKR
jgi:hypothetical protein